MQSDAAHFCLTANNLKKGQGQHLTFTTRVVASPSEHLLNDDSEARGRVLPILRIVAPQDQRLITDVLPSWRHIMSASVYKAVFFDLGDTLVTNGEWISGAKETVISLHQSGIQLGLISNTGTLSRNDLLGHLPPNFDLALFRNDLVLFSSEVGIEKPSIEIFRLAITRAHVSANECLFCTEDLLDSLAAQQVGLHVVRVQFPPNGEIGGLADVLEQIDRLVSQGND
jgi:phosphoglycolate phosphatase-like HAD superfamily hydrolase